jgi:phosphoribosyl 1,2-cyclic phosphodiesterase
VGVDPAALSGILLTHEHGDHARGLDVFTRKYRVPILANAMTREVLRDSVGAQGLWKTVPGGSVFTFGGFDIETFRVPHDAVDPMGFLLRAGSATVGVLSDLGHATTLVKAKLQGLDALFVEANYDEQLLAADTKRPWSTKQRISSRHGHLSNKQTADLLQETAGEGLKRIVLGHLSRDCNSPAAAADAVMAAIAAAGRNCCVECAGQDEPTAWFRVTGPPVQRAASPAPGPLAWEQGELFA